MPSLHVFFRGFRDCSVVRSILPPQQPTIMKSFISGLLLAFVAASANIEFPRTQPACDYHALSHGCLSGQTCTSDNTCIPLHVLHEEDVVPARSDGRCGSDFDGATCDANGPYGSCCSQQGWCGSTPMHCLLSNGCQSGCEAASTQTSSVAHSEPIMTPTTSFTPPSIATGKPTSDGTCGAGHNWMTCDGWPAGGCCSM